MSFFLRHRRRLTASVGGLAAVLAASGLWVSGYQAGQDSRPPREHAAVSMPPMDHDGDGKHINIDAICATELPPEAHDTIENILQGGPYPHDKDGTVFKNKEGVLPPEKNGYYHEFTVETPGSDDRGARRIVTGGEESDQVEDYYSDDHYRSFELVDYKCEGDSTGKPAPSPDGATENNSPHEILDPVCVNNLPKEAHDTLSLIWKYGDDGSKFPFPKKDGSTFEWRPNDPYPFPKKPDGYYREYTVITPGAPNRGKLRIVTGGDPKDKVEDWWSDDHYETFSPIQYSCDISVPNVPSPMGGH